MEARDDIRVLGKENITPAREERRQALIMEWCEHHYHQARRLKATTAALIAHHESELRKWESML